MKIEEFKEGTLVFHEEWDIDTSEPMKVIKKDNKIMLRLKDHPDTEPHAGGESENGWFEYMF